MRDMHETALWSSQGYCTLIPYRKCSLLAFYLALLRQSQTVSKMANYVVFTMPKIALYAATRCVTCVAIVLCKH